MYNKSFGKKHLPEDQTELKICRLMQCLHNYIYSNSHRIFQLIFSAILRRARGLVASATVDVLKRLCNTRSPLKILDLDFVRACAVLWHALAATTCGYVIKFKHFRLGYCLNIRCGSVSAAYVCNQACGNPIIK